MSLRSLASVKAQFSAVVDRVHNTHERVVVTRRGEPVVVVVAVDDLESLEETLTILQNDTVVDELALAEQELAVGDTLDAEELRALADRRPQVRP